MQVQAKVPVFDDFTYLLQQTEASVSPAEIHGILCGLICVEQEYNGKLWFNSMLQLLQSRGEYALSREIIVVLYDVIGRQLSYDHATFQLAIPNEPVSFMERAIALTSWCRGFICGLGLTDKNSLRNISKETQESLRCISEIARLSFDEIHASDNDKAAYELVIDFVRNTVLKFYSESFFEIASTNDVNELYTLH